MAPPRIKLKQAKKGRGSVKLVDEEDYLELGDSHEEAMRKHRVGDPAKALRFADRALDAYSQGLAKFPRSLDLAYNKAQLELYKATDSILSEALDVPVMNILQQALSSHHYARDLEPTHANTLFNLALVLTSIAEILGEDNYADDLEALQIIVQALETQSRCFGIQQSAFAKSRLELEQAMREAAQIDSGGQAATNPAPGSHNINREEQWISVEEPVTASTLLDTIIAQIEALTTLCSILTSSLVSSPESGHASSSIMSWIDSYSTNLLAQILPTLINENQKILEPRLPDVMLPRAIFMSHYLELSLRLSTIDVEKYKQELDAAFTLPGLDQASEDVLMASARALLTFNGALADLISNGALDAVTGSYGALRWKLLVDAQSRLLAVTKIPNIDTHVVATTHHLRGDISLSLQVLAYPPTAHPQARATTSQLLKYAEVYYRNATKLLASFGYSTQEERVVCEFKGAVVSLLQQIATDQAASGSSSGQDKGGTLIGLSASSDQVRLALGPVINAKGAAWVKDHIEEMVNEAMIRPEIFLVMTQV
ncbi:hypothetical protein O1611_g7459 [Lasiodiplodia mahajangana]|uniref:Uncharacterized protein n=1 Tax=Lasiodiplodia mahajangana TaxID=1108764 RepID=A0ACC2JFQ3_9PEZI|nr:hypothetical protein O1611_g7459 [Lasiodiplodia mahajangana]